MLIFYAAGLIKCIYSEPLNAKMYANKELSKYYTDFPLVQKNTGAYILDPLEPNGNA